MMWSICLQSRDGRKVISLPPTSSTQELYEIASKELLGDVQSLMGGFPPRTIPCDGTIPISTILSNQERVQVVLGTTTTKTSTTATSSKVSPKKKAGRGTSVNTTEGNMSSILTTSETGGDEPSTSIATQQQQQQQEEETMMAVRKSKRAASKAATESMPALIKAQENHLKQMSRKATSPKNNNMKRPRASNVTADATNSRSNSSSNNTNDKAKKQVVQSKPVTLSAATGPGRRLVDGAVMVDDDHLRRRATAAGRRAAAAISGGTNGSNTSDMSEALLGALHNKGQMGIVLRKGMKNAVQASYETTRAFSRLAAIQGRSYQLTNCWSDGTTNDNSHGTATTTTTSGSNNGRFLKVVYHGTVDKVKVEETVDLIPLDVLKAVIEGIYSSDTKEALRPENLSKLSPRVLWSCVYYYYDHPTTAITPNNNTDNNNNKNNVQELYQQLLPHLDWTFLRRRAAQLSEKAIENQRQQDEVVQQRKRRKNGRSNKNDNDDDSDDDDDSGNMEQAAQAVAAVEHAMEHLHDYQMEERKARQAQAALARLAQQQQQESGGTASWTLITPSEPDRDELRECIESSLPPAGNSSISVVASTSTWITKLIRECHIHNWRELANVSDLTIVATKLNVAEEYVQSWIDHAQEESVSEIFVQVCDGNIDAVELLTETARTGTPKDLAAWRAIPELLVDQLRRGRHDVQQSQKDHRHDNTKQQAENDGKFSDEANGNKEWMDPMTIMTWCNRAYRLLQDYEWLNWYATPIE